MGWLKLPHRVAEVTPWGLSSQTGNWELAWQGQQTCCQVTLQSADRALGTLIYWLAILHMAEGWN